jgi:hypothetical protein
MADEKNDARSTLLKGAKGFLKAAEAAVSSVKREIGGRGGLVKTVDDGGKEILRAVTNVATQVGSELQDWGKRAQEALDGKPADGTPAPTAANMSGDEWPRSREEYERKYGKVGDDWPKTREEYERRYGRPAEPKKPEKPKGPTDDDPGFRIAGD